MQQLLAEMIDAGCRSAVMEVSSHALAMKRVDGMRFAAAIFTNLTRDHLDFHEDMESHFAAKRRLFEMLEGDAPAVINADDPRAASLVAVCRRAVTYGITQPADVAPGPLTLALEGLSLDVRTPKGSVAIRSRLVGRPNVYNILAATAAAVALDLPLEAVAAGVGALPGVPGRFEVVSSSSDAVTVVVDYAHTDDALRNLLETARPLAARRLITVFGCGGDRDRTKRPLMGMVASRLSDVVIVTSDNPRSEDPARIIEEIRRGITPGAQGGRSTDVVSVVDRAEAIERAVQMAGEGDLVLVAGKGHEKYPADRRPGAAVRRRGRGARGAGPAAAGAVEGDVVAGRAVPLAAADMASAMRGHVVSGEPATVPGGFSIDSRTIAPGQAFFAIVAERDGHEFVADAAAKGAAVVVVSRAVELPAAGPVVVEVADTTRALQELGREVRRRSGAKVVAITGSAGKTTTKEATAGFLEAAFTVVKNPGNLNNHLGLPLSLLEMRHGADVAVMELGMNHAGRFGCSSASPSPRSACGRTWATLTSDTSGLPTPSPTPRPRSSRAPARTRSSSAMPTTRA